MRPPPATSHIYPPTSPERRACETPPPSLEHPAPSKSQPSKQGPAEDISPASPGSQAADVQESYPPGAQAAGIQHLGARMLESRNLIILSSSIGDLLGCNRLPQDATGRPTFWPRGPTNLLKSMLPPAQECQMAHLGTLAEPVEPTCSHKLAGTIPNDTTGDPRHPKCNPNWCQICYQATQRQASKHPSIHAWGPRGRRQRR